MKDILGRRLDAMEVVGGVYTCTVPTGLGWDQTLCPLTITIRVDAFGRNVGDIGTTPEALFDRFSTARSAPTNTYYVDISGNDSSGTGTSAAPVRSIWKAIALGNAAAAPYTVIVKGYGASGSTYQRAYNPWNNNGAGITPTQDCAILANGRVSTGTWDSLTGSGAPAIVASDATYANCSTIALTTADRVVDLASANRFGNYDELVNVATPARCNITPNSWCVSASKVYVNRRDGATPTDTNTRVYRSGVKAFRFDQAVNIFIGGVGPNDGFDIEGGGQAGGPFEVYGPSGMTTTRVVVAKNVSSKYAGGTTNTGSRAFTVESWNGLVALFNCRGDAAMTDAFNHHNANGIAKPYLLTVNCSGYDTGRTGQQSCNGWTTHDNCVAIDVAGHYTDGHGGAARSINTSKSYFAGTVIERDMGDVQLNGGGTFPPTAFRADDSATYWCERTRVVMPAAGYAYTSRSTGKVLKYACAPTASPDDGTVTTYTTVSAFAAST